MPGRFMTMRSYQEPLSALGRIDVGEPSPTAKRTPADLTKREIEELYNFSVGSVLGHRVFDGKQYLALLEKLNIGSDDAYWITKHKYRPEVTVPLARKYFPNQFPEPGSQPKLTRRRATHRLENALRIAGGAFLRLGHAAGKACFELWRRPASQ